MVKIDTSSLGGTTDGAEIILKQCIGLAPGELLAIFWDKTTSEVATLLLNTAKRLGFQTRSCQVCLEEQRGFQSSRGLSSKYLNALEEARGILTCLTDDKESTNFRKELVMRGTNHGARLGHLPGATLKVLAYAAVDHLKIEQHCEELALAMTIGQKAILQTYTYDEKGDVSGEYELFLDLHGFERAPITSTGIIPLGTWGNIPGGETFIAPWEESAEGDFVLNGSFSGNIVPIGRPIILTIKNGHFASIKGDDWYTNLFLKNFEKAQAHKDASHRAIAELGVGVNPIIGQLTGKSLIDEKCAGTAHIAIGDSKRYGGRNASNIHEDLVTISPTLIIDDKEILHHGKYVLQSRDWNEPLCKVILYPPFSHNDFVVNRTDISIEIGPPLKVHREVVEGRIGVYAIGEAEDNLLLSCIFNATDFLPMTTTFLAICSELEEIGYNIQNRDVVRAGLQVLAKHRAIIAH